MQGFGLETDSAGSFCKPFGSSTSGGSQGNIDFTLAQDHEQGTYGCGFTCARSAGQDADFPVICHLHRFALLLGQYYIALRQVVEDGIPMLLAHRWKFAMCQ